VESTANKCDDENDECHGGDGDLSSPDGAIDPLFAMVDLVEAALSSRPINSGHLGMASTAQASSSSSASDVMEHDLSGDDSEPKRNDDGPQLPGGRRALWNGMLVPERLEDK
jgi:hypothetical protein